MQILNEHTSLDKWSTQPPCMSRNAFSSNVMARSHTVNFQARAIFFANVFFRFSLTRVFFCQIGTVRIVAVRKFLDFVTNLLNLNGAKIAVCECTLTCGPCFTSLLQHYFKATKDCVTVPEVFSQTY